METNAITDKFREGKKNFQQMLNNFNTELDSLLFEMIRLIILNHGQFIADDWDLHIRNEANFMDTEVNGYITMKWNKK